MQSVQNDVRQATTAVRVQCEASDCGALLEVVFISHQQLHGSPSSLIVRCGNCNRLLDVQVGRSRQQHGDTTGSVEGQKPMHQQRITVVGLSHEQMTESLIPRSVHGSDEGAALTTGAMTALLMSNQAEQQPHQVAGYQHARAPQSQDDLHGTRNLLSQDLKMYSGTDALSRKVTAPPDMFGEALDFIMMMGGAGVGAGSVVSESHALDVPHGPFYAGQLSPQVTEGGEDAGIGNVGQNPWRDSIGFSESAIGEGFEEWLARGTVSSSGDQLQRLFPQLSTAATKAAPLASSPRGDTFSEVQNPPAPSELDNYANPLAGYANGSRFQQQHQAGQDFALSREAADQLGAHDGNPSRTDNSLPQYSCLVDMTAQRSSGQQAGRPAGDKSHGGEHTVNKASSQHQLEPESLHQDKEHQQTLLSQNKSHNGRQTIDHYSQQYQQQSFVTSTRHPGQMMRLFSGQLEAGRTTTYFKKVADTSSTAHPDVPGPIFHEEGSGGSSQHVGAASSLLPSSAALPSSRTMVQNSTFFPQQAADQQQHIQQQVQGSQQLMRDTIGANQESLLGASTAASQSSPHRSRFVLQQQNQISMQLAGQPQQHMHAALPSGHILQPPNMAHQPQQHGGLMMYSSSPISLKMRPVRDQKRRRERQPRDLSAYNVFMREEVKRLKLEQPSMDHRTAFRTAAINWAKSPLQQQQGSHGFRGFNIAAGVVPEQSMQYVNQTMQQQQSARWMTAADSTMMLIQPPLQNLNNPAGLQQVGWLQGGSDRLPRTASAPAIQTSVPAAPVVPSSCGGLMGQRQPSLGTMTRAVGLSLSSYQQQQQQHEMRPAVQPQAVHVTATSSPYDAYDWHVPTYHSGSHHHHPLHQSSPAMPVGWSNQQQQYSTGHLVAHHHHSSLVAGGGDSGSRTLLSYQPPALGVPSAAAVSLPISHMDHLTHLLDSNVSSYDSPFTGGVISPTGAAALAGGAAGGSCAGAVMLKNNHPSAAPTAAAYYHPTAGGITEAPGHLPSSALGAAAAHYAATEMRPSRPSGSPP
ncbi:hypothetical protein CEUSTIGMA_g5979.t1 [Chlamydomonas eustigma]|uniref:YABBY protein C-terminal domain-containing protein n=1 Tax=Chlamydomonas eustigma TaxID=1157962 RepID=A0A250X6J0_9CHLO|nr:hypothetical protein CEUSTIGMA_g5979.t1 [Chlamydomonas eustigma]|eukprot:GAX78539.1 hypothetical protein CEUSTIGMA_g5979.t1 [Chlamydomonas eustigma]